MYEAMVLAETTSADGDGKVIKPFDEAPDELSKATPENWSLGSLQCVPVNHIILRDRISILSPRHSAEVAYHKKAARFEGGIRPLFAARKICILSRAVVA